MRGDVHEAGHPGAEVPKVLVPVPGASSPESLIASIEAMLKNHAEALEARFQAIEKAVMAATTPAAALPPPAGA